MNRIIGLAGSLVISFDLTKISLAIQKALESEHKVDQEIQRIMDMLDDAEDLYDSLKSETYLQLCELKERKRELRKECKRQKLLFSVVLRYLWAMRNSEAGRSNTSAISDKLLLTIPTPPTALTANCSLKQRRMTCGMS